MQQHRLDFFFIHNWIIEGDSIERVVMQKLQLWAALSNLLWIQSRSLACCETAESL